MRSFIGLAILLLLSSCSVSETTSQKLTIAVASNMHSTIEEVAAAFFEKYGIEVELASGSSGMLTAQIRQGAPFDLFLSANMVYPRSLHEAGFTRGEPSVFAFGKLILWSESELDLAAGITALKNPAIEKFAIANPESAPYGIAAIQALENSMLMPELLDKMIIGESVAQVNQYLSSGAVQAGLTSKSLLFATDFPVDGRSIEIESSLYLPIQHVAIKITRDPFKAGFETNRDDSVNLFHEFLFSADVKHILHRYGYQTALTSS